MGHYKVDVLAVGGHGCQRDKGDGVAVLGCNRSDCPDCITREYLRRLQRSGNSIQRATLTHWPASEPGLGYTRENEVVDDLLTGMRLGDFSPGSDFSKKGPGLTIEITVDDGSGLSVNALPAQSYTTNRRTVRGLLEEVLGEAPNPTPAENDYDFPTKAGVYRFTNAGGSAYVMGADLRHLQVATMAKPWRIKKQPA